MMKNIKTLAWTIVAFIAVPVVAGAAFIYSGLYNVAATEPDDPIVYHALHYVMRRSVAVRATTVQVPDLGKLRLAESGFELYRQYCVLCHGAPGVAPEPLGLGLSPAPPNLAGAARDWPASELYWVIKYGVSKTAMPAWQFRLSEAQLWQLTAFVKTLPTISPQQYKERDKNPPPVTRQDYSGTGIKSASPAAGRLAMGQYMCATCHTIPGLPGLDVQVGPPLRGIANRTYIAGVLLNTPENMRRWLRDPQQVDPLSAMPNLHIREHDVQDIAAYLATLDER